ncbi:hypothetical protein F5148DRAFT_819662 [Russula earlei]|uniref:Uncharacterized protein n=1 Tax=Russula earlei TaxID=71964 RepID=A0ACC0UDT8_9AGAM|nr:hypothetical protein F5148DRAFT_819662 [Russula earlei]
MMMAEGVHPNSINSNFPVFNYHLRAGFMVNFQDPAVIVKDFIALINFWHVVKGLFVWEFFTNLDYEWSIIRGRRPFRWTIWIYSVARISTLAAVFISFVTLDVTAPINCQVWVTFEVIFSYLGIAAASLLIVIRVVAVWNRNKIVVVIAAGLWLADFIVILIGIARLRAVWFPPERTCVVINTHINTPNILFTLVIDILFILIMLVGLFDMRRTEGGTFGIGRLLWNQGVIWLLLATIAEVPPTIFILLNLNGPLNLLFQLPGLVTVSIAATRMYRSLTDFVSRSTNIQCDDLQIPNSNSAKRTKHNSSENNTGRVAVTVDTSYEGVSMSRIRNSGTDGQSRDKLRQFSSPNEEVPNEEV